MARLALPLLLLALPSTGLAQTEPISITVESEEFAVWIDGERCPMPCVRAREAGEVDVATAWHPAYRPERHDRLEITESVTLRYERWSHEGERIAGGVTLALGWALALAGPIVVGSTSRSSWSGLETLAAMVVFSLPLGVLTTAIGAPLAALNDGTHRSGWDDDGEPLSETAWTGDDPVGRVFLELAISVVGLGGLVPSLLLGIGNGTGDWKAAMVATFTASTVAPPFLVTLGGHVAGGRGDLLAASLGALLPAATCAMIYAIWAGIDGPEGVTIIGIPAASVAGVLSLVGSIIGYEIAHGRARRRTETEAGVSVAPGVGVSPDGASLSLSGAF